MGLSRTQRHRRILEMAQKLMAEASRDGFVVKLNMPTPQEAETFKTLPSVSVSDPKTNTVLYEPTKGPYWG